MGRVDRFADQIAKAEARAGSDLRKLAATPADAPIRAPKKAIADRKQFLAWQLGSVQQAELVFERVLAGNELQPVNYLERGATAARAICRVTMFDGSGSEQGFGSGFLVAPGVLLTNNHVLPEADWAARSLAEFDYALDAAGDPLSPVIFGLDPGSLFFTSVELDFTVVAVRAVSRGGGVPLAGFGTLAVIPQVGKVLEGEWLTIVQHPGGGRKAVCVRENRFLKRTDDVLWYSTDTLGGSSGSPVFNNDWQVVALHHSGVPEKDSKGRILTVDGTLFDPVRDREDRIKWVANEGIRVSRIVETLRAKLPTHPLLAMLGVPAAAIVAPPPPVPSAPVPPPPPPPPDSGPADFDAPMAADYAARPGHDPAWLGDGIRVPMPTLTKSLKAEAARLRTAPNSIELKYLGYSVVQHARRRLPIVSVADLDFANRFDMARPKDKWLLDPRILPDQQLGEFYYSNNQFDRGHLTRREDMEYGPTRLDALQRAADTCHFTNAAPQHARFNQARTTWQGLERHLLEDSILREDFRAVVMTGPVLAADDPAWDRFPDIAYPRRFWKVAVARTTAGALFATAFLLDQSDAIDRFGIEAEVPFSAFKTFQLPILEVQRLTGLSFRAVVKGKSRALSGFDPLKAIPAGPQEAVRKPARPRLLGREAMAFPEAAVPAGYVPLWSPRAMVRPGG